MEKPVLTCYNKNKKGCEPMKRSLPMKLRELSNTYRKNEFAIKPYLIRDGKTHPVAIICPGGGYRRVCDFIEGHPFAKKLNKMGYHAIVVFYRVRNLAVYPNPQDDLARAIREVFSHADEWKLNMNRYSVWGSSAGGHLAGSAATLYDAGNPEAEDPIDRISSRPDAFVSCYGATSFRLFQKSWTPQVLGKERMSNQADINRYTAELNVTRDTPPAFIWHTADDAVVPVEVAMVLAEALSAKGVSFEMHVYPHGRHGLGLAKDDPVVSRWTRQVQRWLLGMGFGKE